MTLARALEALLDALTALIVALLAAVAPILVRRIMPALACWIERKLNVHRCEHCGSKHRLPKPKPGNPAA
jgi:hypothetical protein